MRITNSMLVSNYLNDINRNLNKLSGIQSQLASGRKFANISDDPIAFVYSQQARQKIARLAQYQNNVEKADSWVTQTETSVREINDIIVSAYESVIDASTNVKGSYDRENMAEYINQLCEQVITALNTTLGDKYVFSGFNTTAYNGDGTYPAASYDGRVVPPFRYEEYTDTILRFNADGSPVYQQMVNSNGELVYDENGDPEYAPLIEGGNVVYSLDENGDLIPMVDKYGRPMYEHELDANGDYALNADGSYKYVVTGQDADGNDIYQQRYQTEYAQEATEVTKRRLYYNEVPVDEIGSILADPSHPDYNMCVRLMEDIKSMDLGPGISMDVSVNGLDLIFYDKSDLSKNIFNLLDDLYATLAMGGEVHEVSAFIDELQSAQNHLLKKTAELGGKTNRLEMLESRYSADKITYLQMQSDAEDIDFAEILMNYQMAMAVYTASLQTGAMIIQPTLMDFLD